MPTVTANDLERFTLDGLDLHTGGLALEAVTLTPPRKRYDRVSSAERDGTALVREPRYEDREVELKVRVVQTATMDLALAKLAAITDKLQEADRLAVTGRGMTATWTPANATTQLTLYVKGGEVDTLPVDVESGYFVRSPVVTIKLICDPFLYGDWVEGTATSASTPIVTHTISNVAGDVPAESRLIVTDGASQNRDYVAFGLEQRLLGAAPALLVDSVDLITSGYAGTQTTRTGAYSASGVVRGTLTTTPVALCSTAELTHKGTFRVIARIWASAAGVRTRLSWRAGRDTFTANGYVQAPAAAAFCEVDLGEITIPAAELGTQTWQGRVEAYSDVAGDTLDVDYLVLIPSAEGYAKARRVQTFEAATVFSARDEFDQSAGVLAGKALPVGGTWSGAGDADDFSVETTGKTAQRTAVSDAGVAAGRYALAGTTSFTATAVQADFKVTAATGDVGLIARYSATTDWCWASVSFGTVTPEPGVRTFVGGVESAGLGLQNFQLPSLVGGWVRMRFVIDTAGRFYLWVFLRDQVAGGPVIVGSAASLATGGALASGRVGFYDLKLFANASTRNVDNFMAFVPTADAAIFSGQSAEFRSHGDNPIVREDSTGVYYGRPHTARGSRFFLPPAGDDGLASRVAVMARRTDVETLPAADVTDSTTVQVSHRPRFLNAPR